MKSIENTLRIVDPALINDPDVLAYYRSILTADEQARIDRFVFEQDRHVRLVARASLRLFLAEFTGVPAQDLRFGYNEYGKPFLQDPAEFATVRFNVSHTKDRIALYLSATHDVGVDIESVKPMTDLHSIAGRFFAKPEFDSLRTLTTEAATQRFFQYWTLKEAYIKARGMGLSMPLDQFWFELGGPEPRIHFFAGIEDDPQRWRFTQQRLDSGHYLATALGTPEQAF